ncbi:Fic family protein [Natribacillus halophilus]|uniref:Fic family protein n=1 Tax=Natribacillus halophilus TaxID=549003 RepID=A0A1G8LR95_9BACI|nr:Fic family protein [Natribacillus halophilus]SDI58153.1 Fic family protein [Natribacillus halophilus]
MEKLLKEIDELKKQLDEKRPLPPETLQNLKEHLLVEWTYHSNAIEGNTLTLAETKVVLEDGITVGGKTMREHLEAINHKEAILYLEEVIRRGEQLTQHTIKTIHSLILRGIDRQNAGTYRKTNVVISGAEHRPPDPVMVQEQMDDLMVWYEDNDHHPVLRAAILHSAFVKIHPFMDGNGRTARLLLNLELMRSGYVPIVIHNHERLAYYRALDQSHTTGDHSDFVEIVGSNLKEALQFYLEFA